MVRLVCAISAWIPTLSACLCTLLLWSPHRNPCTLIRPSCLSEPACQTFPPQLPHSKLLFFLIPPNCAFPGFASLVWGPPRRCPLPRGVESSHSFPPFSWGAPSNPISTPRVSQNPNPSPHTAAPAGFFLNPQMALVSAESLPPSSSPVPVAPSAGWDLDAREEKPGRLRDAALILHRVPGPQPPPVLRSAAVREGPLTGPHFAAYTPASCHQPRTWGHHQAHRPYRYTNTSSFPQYFLSHNG